MVSVGPVISCPECQLLSRFGVSATNWCQTGDIGHFACHASNWKEWVVSCQLLDLVKFSAASCWGRNGMCPENQLLGGLV